MWCVRVFMWEKVWAWLVFLNAFWKEREGSLRGREEMEGKKYYGIRFSEDQGVWIWSIKIFTKKVLKCMKRFWEDLRRDDNFIKKNSFCCFWVTRLISKLFWTYWSDYYVVWNLLELFLTFWKNFMLFQIEEVVQRMLK